jgi:hypothetical protein
MNRNRKGIIHECQPEVSDWVLCADFEDEMPHDNPERHKWHNRVLDDFQTETGVYLLDLTVDEHDGDPDYDEVAFRLTNHGFDIYNSDTYFEVYNKAVFCDDEECGEVR